MGSIEETPPTQPTQETALPTPTPPPPEASAPETVSIQSKEPSLMSKLQAPDKEAPGLLSICRSGVP